MTYSRTEIRDRLRALLPARWFGEYTPVLDSLLNALSAGWEGLFGLLAYVSDQTRINTAFDYWLDFTAQDYFGPRVTRMQEETDSRFRVRIKNELIRDRCTRAAMHDILAELTGKPPVIFEPTNPYDTGCYGSPTQMKYGRAGYGVSGGWGCLKLAFQTFVKVSRPAVAGIGLINGWGGEVGGFGIGSSAYARLDMHSTQLHDSELYGSILRSAPAGSVIWTLIEP